MSQTVQEIACVWFESVGKWFALDDTGAVLASGNLASGNPFGEVMQAALAAIGAVPADFDHEEWHSELHRYFRDPGPQVSKDGYVCQEIPE